jgi:HPt (histidine-containing phosphotransfer) domain-containing protein
MLLNSQFYDLVSLNKQAVAHICETFDQGVHTALNHARLAFERDDREMLSRHAHALKGMCLNLGAETVGEHVAKLEDIAKRGSKKAITTELSTIEKLLKETQQEIRKALN